jgi:hypothetical protein
MLCCNRALLIWLTMATLLVPAAAQECTQNSDGGASGGPALHAEARPDELSVQAGKRGEIDVLANDIGAPSDANMVPEMRLEGTIACGSAKLNGRRLIYEGGSECIGQPLNFGYSARLRDPGTCQERWVTGLITVTVTEAPAVPPVNPPVAVNPPGQLSCEIPNAPWRLIKIDGGQFNKTDAPPEIADFVKLITESSFTVSPLCLMAEDVSAQEFEKFFGTISEGKRRAQFPEAFEQGSENSRNIFDPAQSAAATQISQRMAQAYATYQSEAISRNVGLPSLNEYIGALWELQRKRPDAPETALLLVNLRSGNLHWTNSRCLETAFLALGPQLFGSVTTLCFDQARRERTGFRLLVR